MSDDENRILELRTYTSLWQIEKRIYKLYDFTLPAPISLRMVGIGVIAVVPWFTLMAILQVPFNIDSGMWMMWIAPPVIFAYFANRPIAEGKTLIDLVGSQATYFFGQAQFYARMRPWNQPAYQHVSAYRWEPTEAEPKAPSKQKPDTDREPKQVNKRNKFSRK